MKFAKFVIQDIQLGFATLQVLWSSDAPSPTARKSEAASDMQIYQLVYQQSAENYSLLQCCPFAAFRESILLKFVAKK